MTTLTRRTLLKGTTGLIASTVTIPYAIGSSAQSRDGTTAPSKRLTIVLEASIGEVVLEIWA